MRYIKQYFSDYPGDMFEDKYDDDEIYYMNIGSDSEQFDIHQNIFW